MHRFPQSPSQAPNRCARSGRIPELLQADWPVQISHKKYFPFQREQISHICETVSPTEGRIAIVTNAGWDAVDAAASGALVVAGRIERYVSERSGAQDERCFNAFFKTSDGCTWLTEATTRVAAYGEVVWSWHPLLMSSSWDARELYRISSALHPRATVTRGIRRRGELEGNR